MKRQYKGLLLAIATVWVVAAIALAPYFVGLHAETRMAQHQFDEFASALAAENNEEAYEHCGLEFRAAMSYDQFVATARLAEQVWTIDSRETPSLSAAWERGANEVARHDRRRSNLRKSDSPV